MVTFDHRSPGTPEQVWRDAGVLDRPRPLETAGVDALVVLAAHPDDETLGAGGLISTLGSAGVPVTVVVATDGEGCFPGLDEHRLRATRRREVVDAVARLAPAARVVLLGLPDGGLREHRETLRRALGASLDLAGGERPLLCATWRGDGHRDHRVAGEVAAEVAADRAVRLVEYPIWLWHWGAPQADAPWDDLVGLRLGAAELAAKYAALGAHVSQVRPPADWSAEPSLRDEPPVVGPEMHRYAARDVEVFVETPVDAEPDAAPASSTTDQPGTTSLDRAFFDDFYTGRDDPWGFESRWYEERKRAVLLASLPRERFRAGLEIGCSTGVLTAALAERCDAMTGVDVADAPLAAARRRLGDEVSLHRLDTPHEWPDGAYDLVVLSEVLYYYGRRDLDLALDRATRSLTADGVLVACHWRHPVADYPLGGDAVHDVLRARPGLDVLARHEEEDFLLDVLVRAPARSVARSTGLL